MTHLIYWGKLQVENVFFVYFQAQYVEVALNEKIITDIFSFYVTRRTISSNIDPCSHNMTHVL